MKTTRQQRRDTHTLPDFLRPIFWDCDFDELSWKHHLDYIVERILACGGEQEIAWLRRRLDDNALRQWFGRNKGKALSERQLRYWELVLGLPQELVDEWLSDPSRQIWDKRT